MARLQIQKGLLYIPKLLAESATVVCQLLIPRHNIIPGGQIKNFLQCGIYVASGQNLGLVYAMVFF